MVTTRSGKRTLGSSKEVQSRKRNRRANESECLMLTSSQYPVLNMTLQCMDSAQLITYSFSSPQAANAVKRLGLEVELMEIYLAGVLCNNTDPENEQGVELTFPNESRKKVLWWFTNTPVPSQPLHQKIAIDGTVIDECFQTSDTLIGCHTTPPRMIDQLKIVENHFRSIFLIRKTNFEMDCYKIEEYDAYLDPENPKTCNQLRIYSQFLDREDSDLLFTAIEPKILHYDLTYLSEPMSEICVDELRITRIKFNALQFGLNEVTTPMFSFGIDGRDMFTVKMIVALWKENLYSRDRLEVTRMETNVTHDRQGRRRQRKFNWDDIIGGFDVVPYDGRRRPSHYRKIVDGVTELELDLSRGVDISREDGRWATLYLEENKTVFWFIVWQETEYREDN